MKKETKIPLQNQQFVLEQVLLQVKGQQEISKAHLMAKGIKAGTIFVNNYDESDLTVPAGGFKQSGIGIDNSYHALDTYLQIKSTWIKLADK